MRICNRFLIIYFCDLICSRSQKVTDTGYYYPAICKQVADKGSDMYLCVVYSFYSLGNQRNPDQILSVRCNHRLIKIYSFPLKKLRMRNIDHSMNFRVLSRFSRNTAAHRASCSINLKLCSNSLHYYKLQPRKKNET